MNLAEAAMERPRKYWIRARVTIDIETDFEDAQMPTAETLRVCVEDDIAAGRDIAGAQPECRVVDFHREDMGPIED